MKARRDYALEEEEQRVGRGHLSYAMKLLSGISFRETAHRPDVC